MKLTGELFDIYFFAAKTPADNRVDVAVGLKVSKKAVVRNRLKRQIREILRKYTAKNSFRGQRYVKISARPSIIGRRFGQIKENLETALGRIK
ncbi:MAG: ribonuclease P protein component [Patescibacteria group bacterium]